MKCPDCYWEMDYDEKNEIYDCPNKTCRLKNYSQFTSSTHEVKA